MVRNDTGVFNGQLRVDTAALAPGWRKLTIQGKAIDPATGATNTGRWVHEGPLRLCAHSPGRLLGCAHASARGWGRLPPCAAVLAAALLA